MTTLGPTGYAPERLGPTKGVVTGATPSVPRGGVPAAIEGDRYILTLSGILGDHPPIDPAGLEAFAATLVFPDIDEALQGAQPLDDPVAIRFPASVGRRYERLRRFPQQLLVTGDAVCSFNPVYGQGITIAALEALALRQLLAGGVPQPGRYFRDIARLVDVAWDMAVGGDLALPQVTGPRQQRFGWSTPTWPGCRPRRRRTPRWPPPSSGSSACSTDPKPCSEPTGLSACCAHRATPVPRNAIGRLLGHPAADRPASFGGLPPPPRRFRAGPRPGPYSSSTSRDGGGRSCASRLPFWLPSSP